MTPAEWERKAARCCEMAATVQHAVARQILLEAAGDYLDMAQRETALQNLNTAYQISTAVQHGGRSA